MNDQDILQRINYEINKRCSNKDADDVKEDAGDVEENADDVEEDPSDAAEGDCGG